MEDDETLIVSKSETTVRSFDTDGNLISKVVTIVTTHEPRPQLDLPTGLYL